MRPAIHVLMLGIGGSGFLEKNSQDVVRHLRYLDHCGPGSCSDLLNFEPGGRSHPPATFDGRLTVEVRGGAYPSYSRKIAARAEVLCRENAYDLIYCQDPFATAWLGRSLARKHGIPLIIGNHSNFFAAGWHWIREKPLFFSALRLLGGWNVRSAGTRGAFFQILNEEERSFYCRRFGIDPDRVGITATPVPLDRFREQLYEDERIAERRKLDFPDEAVVVLWVGRPVRFKRLPWLIRRITDVMRQRPEIFFVVCGKRNEVQDDFAMLADNFAFPDRLCWLDRGIANEDLRGLYQACDLYVHTSIYEGLGRVMLEAGASGLPIVATTSGGADRIVEDGVTGRLLRSDDEAGFVKAVIELADSKLLRTEMGIANRNRILEVFDEDRCIGEIVDLWYRAIEGQPAGA